MRWLRFLHRVVGWACTIDFQTIGSDELIGILFISLCATFRLSACDLRRIHRSPVSRQSYRVIAHKLGITRTHTVRFTLFHSYIQTPKHSYHFPLTATLIPNNTLHLRIFSDAIGRKDSSISIVSPLEQHFLIERASCGSSHSWKLCTKEFYWRYTASWNQVEVA